MAEKNATPIQNTSTPKDEINTSANTNDFKTQRQKETLTDKKGNTTTVEVTQTSIDEKHNATIITTEKTNKNGTQKTVKTEGSVKTYDADYGYTKQDTTYASTYTYDKHHNLKKEVKETHISHTKESGAIDRGYGHTGTTHSETSKVSTTHLDKKGNIIQTEYHSSDTSSQMRVDSKAQYTAEEKAALKQEIRVTATATQITIENNSKKQKFSASINPNTEHYSTTKGNKITEVGIDSTGSLYGTVTTEKGNNEQNTKDLSQKELKKELKAARKKADESIRAVTEAKNAQELTASIPSPMNIGTTTTLGDLFNKTVNEETYTQSKEDLAQDYQKRQKQDQVPIGVIMKEKLQNNY